MLTCDECGTLTQLLDKRKCPTCTARELGFICPQCENAADEIFAGKCFPCHNAECEAERVKRNQIHRGAPRPSRKESPNEDPTG